MRDRARRRGPGGRGRGRVPGGHRGRRLLCGRRVVPRVRQVGRRGRPVLGVHLPRRRRGRAARRRGGGAGGRGGPRRGREGGAGARRGRAEAARAPGLRRQAAAVRVHRRGRVRARLVAPPLPHSPRRARRVFGRRRRGCRRGRQRVRDRCQGQQDLEGQPGRQAALGHQERHLLPARGDAEQPHRPERHRVPPQRLPPRRPYLRRRPLQGRPQDGDGERRRRCAGLAEEGGRAGAALPHEAGRRRHAKPAGRELRRLGDRRRHRPVRRAAPPGGVVGDCEGRGRVRQPHRRVRARQEEDPRHRQGGVRAFVAGAAAIELVILCLASPRRLQIVSRCLSRSS